MLKDLRVNSNGLKPPWVKETIKGLCANKGCNNISTKECAICGIRYCSQFCQKEDWKCRHKHFCKPKDIRRTQVLFGILNRRLKDYKCGNTSFGRYYNIASAAVFQNIFIENNRENPDQPLYNVYNIDPVSGRVFTVLTPNEEICQHQSNVILRKEQLYIINSHLLTKKLTDEQNDFRINFGLDSKEAVELVPVNKNLQKQLKISILNMTFVEMRAALSVDLNCSLFYIYTLIADGIGCCYGNPVFLSLESALAYQDFIAKNSFLRRHSSLGKYPLHLFYSVLYPTFKPSLLTGNIEHDDCDLSYGDDACPEYVLEKTAITQGGEGTILNHKFIFVEELMEKEEKEKPDIYTVRDGDPKENNMAVFNRWQNHQQKHQWWVGKYFDISKACSESLDILPVDQSCFGCCVSNSTNNNSSSSISSDDSSSNSSNYNIDSSSSISSSSSNYNIDSSCSSSSDDSSSSNYSPTDVMIDTNVITKQLAVNHNDGTSSTSDPLITNLMLL